MSSSQMGLVPLSSPSLFSSVQQHHLRETENRLLLAASMGRDLAKREVRDAWKGLDRRLEDSEWLGSGLGGSAAEFTRWDALKKATTDAVHEGEHRVTVLKSQLASSPALSTPLSPSYAHSPTPNLQKGVALHGQMAKQSAGYAVRDAQTALEQVGMAVREEAEVVRRGVVRRLQEGAESPRASSPPSTPSPFHPLPLPRRPLSHPLHDALSLRNSHLLASDGLLNAAGVAVDVGVGVAVGEWVERRGRRKKREERMGRDGRP